MIITIILREVQIVPSFLSRYVHVHFQFIFYEIDELCFIICIDNLILIKLILLF